MTDIRFFRAPGKPPPPGPVKWPKRPHPNHPGRGHERLISRIVAATKARDGGTKE